MNDWTDEQMLDEKDAGKIRKVMCLLRVAWVAQLVLLAAMVVIAHVVRPKMIESGKVGDQTFLTVLNISIVIVGAISLAIAYYLRRYRIRTGLLGFTTITMPNIPPYLAGYAEAVFAASSIAAAVGICGFVPFIMGALTVRTLPLIPGTRFPFPALFWIVRRYYAACGNSFTSTCVYIINTYHNCAKSCRPW